MTSSVQDTDGPQPTDRPLAQTAVKARSDDTAPSRDESAAPSLLAYPATYALIAVNVLVYLLMVRVGPLPELLRAHIMGPGRTGFPALHQASGWVLDLLTAPFSERELTTFGACIPDGVLFYGQWWRLITSIFVHVTLLHLLLNMWCLWNLGLFGEPLLGKPGLVAVYLLTGLAGMLQSVLTSLFTGHLGVIVAGASGAVFGIAGILIVLLSNRKLAAPWEELRSLRRQVAFFALANLLLGGLPDLLLRVFPGFLQWLHLEAGALPSVDNGAHLGGLLCGLALGLPLFPRMTSGRSTYRARQAIVFGTAALMLCLLSYAVAVFAHSLAG